MNGSSWARVLFVLVVAAVAQVAVIDQLTVLGAHADLFPVLAVGAGLLSGPQRGAVVGFVVGLVADLLVTTPYGLSPLAFTIVAFGMGLARAIPQGRDALSADIAACVLGTALATLLYAVLGAAVRQPGMLGATGADALIVTALGAIVLAYPALWALRWALRDVRAPSGYAIGAGGSAAG